VDCRSALYLVLRTHFINISMSADTNSAQDSPITFNTFKQNFDSKDEKDR